MWAGIRQSLKGREEGGTAPVFRTHWLNVYFIFSCPQAGICIICSPSSQAFVKSESAVAQSCQTLSDPMDCSLPGSSVHGIFQARVLEWVAISFSRGSSQPRDGTWVSHIAGRHFTVWATREASSQAFVLRFHYTTGFPGSPACRWQTVGLSLRNLTSQFLIINLSSFPRPVPVNTHIHTHRNRIHLPLYRYRDPTVSIWIYIG